MRSARPQGPDRIVGLPGFFYDYTYCLWYKPNKTDLEFGRAFARLVTVLDHNGNSLVSPTHCVPLHAAFCWQIENLPFNKDAHPQSTEFPITGTHEELCINDDSYLQYFKIRPLFRAIIMAVNTSKLNARNLQVNLIRTGNEKYLSAPINFDGICSMSSGYRGPGTREVETDLKTAVEFVTSLEEREAKAFPEKYKPCEVFDPTLFDPRRVAREQGYPDKGLIEKNSTAWCDVEPKEPKLVTMINPTARILLRELYHLN
ncbi:MAG: hypothetical protein M1831_002480 [Alyxoria varia]|nr:MAG: hypothetical protein M1831_002480 [Alyxoria varia]